ncbi:SLAM family member 5-like isoform X2 [Siphateles boraxobius]|uniref:SLAM family member 5-like isoform X2 n=1 Tax=Siphateles boraxobius TaxID=180520 RepID=UPI0040629D03
MIHKSFFFCLWIWFSRGVFGAGTDEVKSVLVMEGDSVSLNTDVTEIQSTDQILWTYRHDSTEIRLAGIHKQNIDMYDSNVTFGDRLQMDSQTGSLTIRNIRTTDSGLYKLSIFSSNISYKRFNVMVYAPLQIPVITGNSSNCFSSSLSERSTESRCSLVCSALNVSDVTLSWYKGISVLSSISVSDLSISLSLPLEVEYQDKNTYSCVINNPIRNQTTHLDITQACHTCKELMQPSHLVGIVVSSVILTVLVVAAIICFRSKSKQGTQKVQSCEEEVLYTETTFRARSVHSTKANGEDHIIYSSINVT